MEFLKIIITSVGSVIAMFLMTKLIGNKQMNQLNLFDYINGITIGSIGAELAITSEKDFWKPLTALFIYAFATLIINLMRRVLEGRSIIIMENGKLFPERFKKAKIDLNEFLTQCRVAGYFDLSQINSAVIEPNGRISFLPQEKNRPLTAADMELAPQQSKLMKCVIIDGKIMEQNLSHTGYDANYLKARLKEQNLSVKDVFLAIGDNSGVFTFFKYETARHKDDPFQ